MESYVWLFWYFVNFLKLQYIKLTCTSFWEKYDLMTRELNEK